MMVDADKLVEENLAALQDGTDEPQEDVKRRVSQKLDQIYETRISISHKEQEQSKEDY